MKDFKLINMSTSRQYEVAYQLCPTVAYPIVEGEYCKSRCQNWVCWGIPGHTGPHAAHVGNDRAAALWDVWTDEQFEAMQMFLRLME